jgi:hypothetical protein
MSWFVSGAAYTLFATPVTLLQQWGGNDSLVLTWLHLPCVLLGCAFAGFFAAAACPRDRLWQALYAGLSVGLVWSVLLGLFAAFVSAGKGADGELAEVPASVWWTAAATSFIALPLLAAVTVLGGAAERGLNALMRRLRPPKEWLFRTGDGRQIKATDPARHPLQARFWRTARWLLLLALVPTVFTNPKESGRDLVSAVVLFKVCGVMARRRTALSAREALRKDDRPPIIYLRSFRDDGRAVYTGKGWARSKLLSPSLEETLAQTMQRYGPFVAIGRPGEEVPEMGAARMYVSDADWQTVVADLLARPGAMAVLQAGATSGLRWELNVAGRLLQPDQLLVFVPFALEKSARARTEQYAAFRGWAAECLPEARLPERLPEKTRFFYFEREPAWQPSALQRQSRVSRQHPLAVILAGIQDHWHEMTPSRFFGGNPILLVVLSLVVVAALALLGFLFFHTRGSQPDPVVRPPAPGPLPAPGNLQPPPMPAIPPPPVTVEYEGRAAPYKIRLSEQWKENSKPEGNVDRKFDIGESPTLSIIVADSAVELDRYPAEFLAGMRENEKFKKVELLEQRRSDRKGQTWLELKLSVTVQEGTAWMYVRVWSGPEKSVYLMAVTERDDAAARQLVQDALDGFELPAAPWGR